jgi:hypothetical protein
LASLKKSASLACGQVDTQQAIAALGISCEHGIGHCPGALTGGAIAPGQRNVAMSKATDADFIYSANQPLTSEQRIEVLELQVAEMREQLEGVIERLRAIVHPQSSRGLT